MVLGDEQIAVKQFNVLLNDSVTYVPLTDTLKLVPGAYALNAGSAGELPQVQLFAHQAEAARWRWRTERSKLLPDFFASYNNQSLAGSQLVNGVETNFGTGKRFNYVSAGISIPIFAGAQSARISAAKVEWQLAQKRTDYAALQLQTEQQNAAQQIQKYAVSLNYFEGQGLKNADMIIGTANKQFAGGDINYLQWVILVDQAINIRNEYLESLYNYNLAVIQAQKLNNL